MDDIEAEADRLERIACQGTDQEWFEATGNCGHCGSPGHLCECTDKNPCGCGPHDQALTTDEIATQMDPLFSLPAAHNTQEANK